MIILLHLPDYLPIKNTLLNPVAFSFKSQSLLQIRLILHCDNSFLAKIKAILILEDLNYSIIIFVSMQKNPIEILSNLIQPHVFSLSNVDVQGEMTISSSNSLHWQRQYEREVSNHFQSIHALFNMKSKEMISSKISARDSTNSTCNCWNKRFELWWHWSTIEANELFPFHFSLFHPLPLLALKRAILQKKTSNNQQWWEKHKLTGISLDSNSTSTCCRSTVISSAPVSNITVQFNYWTIELLSYSTIQLLSYSTIQLLSYSTIQLLSYSTIQLLYYWTFQLLESWNSSTMQVTNDLTIQLFNYWIGEIL